MTSFGYTDFHAFAERLAQNNTEFIVLSVIYTHIAVAVGVACIVHTQRIHTDEHLIVRLNIYGMYQ